MHLSHCLLQSPLGLLQRLSLADSNPKGHFLRTGNFKQRNCIAYSKWANSVLGKDRRVYLEYFSKGHHLSQDSPILRRN